MSQPLYSVKSKVALAVTGALTFAFSSAPVLANETSTVDDDVEVIQVVGLRGSVKAAMFNKREENSISDGIAAEDLGKFPDLNVAESLQRITGVSIDRDGGEGQQVTVRGFGPQFNTVLVNGRQIATDSPGREFNFDVLAADQITGADVFKSGKSSLQEGGIGATINVNTARPLDYDGLKVAGSVKGVYEDLSEEFSPAVSALVSNTFADDKMGVLLAVSHSERNVQINRIETAGWRPGQTLSNRNDGVIATNVYFPRNWDQIVDEQERTRTNISLVGQYAPSDELTITLDGFSSQFEVDSVATDLASWFEPDRVGSDAIVDSATGTALFFTQEMGIHGGSGDPATDLVSHTRNRRDISIDAVGLNVEWVVNDNFEANFDISTSSAENDRAGKDRFNVIGIPNNYEFDSTGSIPTVRHDGFSDGNLPDPSTARLHYNERGNRFTDEDEITEFKADFAYQPESDVFTGMKFGAYRQEREKSSFQEFTNAGCAFCGYNEPVPDGLLYEYTAQNYFSGLIDTFYAYDGEAYFAYMASLGTDFVPELQNNRYTINEDITSLYAEFNFESEIGDMPLYVNYGARYAETDISVMAIQSPIVDVVPTSDLTLFSNVTGDATEIVEGGSYANLLSNFNAKLEIESDKILRFAIYDSLTRPTMSQLSPATLYNEPRRQNLTASGGNPTLEPFKATNWDVSFEWYYNDSSLFSFAVFNKEVEDFIVTLTGEETFTMADRLDQPGFRCNVDNSALCAEGLELDETQPGVDIVANTEELNGSQEVYTVSRPRNGEDARVTGYEIALTHIFDNGFGVTANATVVNSNASLDADSTSTFALEGLGDSQNLILFYEQDGFQARIAYNNRDAFLRRIDNGFNGEPVNTNSYSQWDASASYDVNENFTVFVEGINLTGEELIQTGRFANQIYNIEDNGSRYAVGVRAKF